MRRLALLLGIVAAIAGPMLRQAEAADDLARALCTWLAPEALESCDGGVGDEPEITTAKLDTSAAACRQDDAAQQVEQILPCAAFCPPLVPSFHDATQPIATSQHQRLAWLQRLLV